MRGGLWDPGRWLIPRRQLSSMLSTVLLEAFCCCSSLPLVSSILFYCSRKRTLSMKETNLLYKDLICSFSSVRAAWMLGSISSFKGLSRLWGNPCDAPDPSSPKAYQSHADAQASPGKRWKSWCRHWVHTSGCWSARDRRWTSWRISESPWWTWWSLEWRQRAEDGGWRVSWAAASRPRATNISTFECVLTHFMTCRKFPCLKCRLLVDSRGFSLRKVLSL